MELLKALAQRAQLLADDASSDHLYVGNECSGPEGGLYAHLTLDNPRASRVIDGLIHGVVQAIKIHRANGGVGRGVVWFEDGPELMCRYRFLTSVEEEIALLREHAA